MDAQKYLGIELVVEWWKWSEKIARKSRTRRGQRIGDEDVDEPDLEAERGDADDAGQAL